MLNDLGKKITPLLLQSHFATELAQRVLFCWGETSHFCDDVVDVARENFFDEPAPIGRQMYGYYPAVMRFALALN